MSIFRVRSINKIQLINLIYVCPVLSFEPGIVIVTRDGMWLNT